MNVRLKTRLLTSMDYSNFVQSNKTECHIADTLLSSMQRQRNIRTF
jgi:hypothetical protein